MRINSYMVRDLPDGIKNVLKEVGYGKKDIGVEPQTIYSPAAMSGEGLKAFVGVVDLGTGQYKVEWGSWGGPSMFEQRQIDLDTSVYPMPYNGAVVKGHRGGGRPVYAHVFVHPENLQKLLPAGPSEELSDKQKMALAVIAGIKGGHRQEYFLREGLGRYGTENSIIQRLEQLGLVKITKTGVQVTTEGRNVRESLGLRVY